MWDCKTAVHFHKHVDCKQCNQNNPKYFRVYDYVKLYAIKDFEVSEF